MQNTRLYHIKTLYFIDRFIMTKSSDNKPCSGASFLVTLVAMVFTSLPTKKQLQAKWRHEGIILLHC